MKKKKTTNETSRSQSESTPFVQPRYARRPPGMIGTFFSAVISLLLAVVLTLFLLFLFARAVNETMSFPSWGSVSGELLSELIGAWYSLVFAVSLVLILLLLIILINLHFIRNAFAFAGTSAIIAALLSMVISFAVSQAVQMLPGELQFVLVNSIAVLKSFLAVCAVFLTAIGAAGISIYSCISAIKEEQE